AFLEPESGLGFPSPDGGVTLKLGTQCAFDDRAQLARILALPEDKVRVVQLPVGGAFGGKQDILIYQYLALGAILSQRPTKITLTREESLRTHVKRHPAQIHMRLGADSSGRLLALQAGITLDAGAYASLTTDVLENALVFGGGPYHIPNVDLEGWAWYTNTVPSGAMRGFGANQVAFALECTLDEIARRLEIDPFDIRELDALDVGLPTVAGHILEEGVVGIKPTIVAAREELGRLVVPAASDGRKIGIGVACGVKNIGFGHGLSESAGAIAELHPSGRVAIRMSQHEYGQGAMVGLARLASRELGIPIHRISVLGPDTAETPPTGPTTASRQTFLSGNAVLEACTELKAIVFGHAAEELDAPPSRVVFRGDELVDRDSGRSIRISDVGSGVVVERRYEADDTTPLPEPRGRRPDPEPPGSQPTHWGYAYATQAAVVEVDEATGRVRVLKVISAHDLGHVISQGAAEGQVQSGVMQGLGYALSEQFQVEQG
ncbi:unnamed protein product, partial [marine sediment metagenome]